MNTIANTTYRVHCYAQEDLSKTFEHLTAEEAIDIAYAFVGWHLSGAAHILREGTSSGIYIARPQDLTRHDFDIDAAVTQLQQTKYS